MIDQNSCIQDTYAKFHNANEHPKSLGDISLIDIKNWRSQVRHACEWKKSLEEANEFI